RGGTAIDRGRGPRHSPRPIHFDERPVSQGKRGERAQGAGRHTPGRGHERAAGRSAMTVVGKILVFVNLIFSLLTAGLIIMVYTTRTNWHDANTKLQSAMQVTQAQATAE